MSYIKTTWANGDTITSEKLNNAESGIEEINMSYEKQTWSNGDTITADKLNHMEDGISGGGGGSSDFAVATVTVIPDGLPDGVGIKQVILDGILYFPFYVAGESSYGRETTISNNGVFSVLMYQNQAYFGGEIIVVGSDDKKYVQSGEAVCSGGVTYDEMDRIAISGDGTMTVPVERSR